MEIHELIPEGPWDEEGAVRLMEQWANGWAEKLNPKAIEEHGAAIRQHGHTTQSTEGETIDLTPVGCQTPEGNAPVLQAQQEWDSATHLLANTLKEILDTGDSLYAEGQPDRDAMHTIQALIGARDRKQEAFLRAVCGQPHRPEKPKLKTYPATVNGKTVQVTIPED